MPSRTRPRSGEEAAAVVVTVAVAVVAGAAAGAESLRSPNLWLAGVAIELEVVTGAWQVCLLFS